MLARGGSHGHARWRLLFLLLKEGWQGLVRLLVFVLLVDGCVRGLFIVVLHCFRSVHDNIEHIIGVFLPLRGEEGHHIARLALLLSQGRLWGFFLICERTWFPVPFDIIMHGFVFCSVLLLLKIPILAENRARESDFITWCWSINKLARPNLTLVPL